MANISIFIISLICTLFTLIRMENIQVPEGLALPRYALDITKELQSNSGSTANNNMAKLVENQVPYPVYVRQSDAANTNGVYQTASQFVSLIVRDMFVYFLIRLFITKLINVLGLFVDIQSILTDNWSSYLTKVVLNTAIQFISQVVYYLMGGTAVVVVGGIMATLICYYTNLCNINLSGLNAYNLMNQNPDWKNGGKPFITPEKLTSAAVLIQDAIGKYNKMQQDKTNSNR